MIEWTTNNDIVDLVNVKMVNEEWKKSHVVCVMTIDEKPLSDYYFDATSKVFDDFGVKYFNFGRIDKNGKLIKNLGFKNSDGVCNIAADVFIQQRYSESEPSRLYLFGWEKLPSETTNYDLYYQWIESSDDDDTQTDSWFWIKDNSKSEETYYGVSSLPGGYDDTAEYTVKLRKLNNGTLLLSYEYGACEEEVVTLIDINKKVCTAFSIQDIGEWRVSTKGSFVKLQLPDKDIIVNMNDGTSKTETLKE